MYVSVVSERLKPPATLAEPGHEAAAQYSPRKTVVVSDGQPDSETEALAAAEALTGQIDVIYCGPDSDTHAILFMRRLARVGCGSVVMRDIRRCTGPQLGAQMRSLFALPAPGGGP